LWRRYSDELHRLLVARWLPTGRLSHVLKTDAFDEATSDLGLRVITAGTAVSLDVSVATLQMARRRHEGLLPLAGNVRSLPLKSDVFDLVVSTSTLDHMDRLDDIRIALLELFRVTKPGGRLILTLDNGRNPIVALRGALPYRWLRALRIVPYKTGANCGPTRLKEMVTSAGFDVVSVGSLMHTPRFPSVILCNVCDWLRAPAIGRLVVRSMLGAEGLERLPTRFLTGYFVAVVATRPQGDAKP
jgi:SAM-dependent methyltransferase